MKTIGVLAVQGSFAEHLRMLARVGGVRPLPVKSRAELEAADGLILPGGESTAQGRLLRDFGLLDPIREKIRQGMPVWGTCAGMILLARRIAGGEPAHLGVMDITVMRNAFGGQLESFTDTAAIPEVSADPLPLVFIRAPWVESAGPGVRCLARKDGKIVAVRQGSLLATSFHPELTGDDRFHRFFTDMV